MITVTEIVELEDAFELRNLFKDSPAVDTINAITAAHKSEEFMELLENMSEEWDFDDLEAYLLTDYTEIFRNLGMVEGEDFARGSKKRVNHFSRRPKGYLTKKTFSLNEKWIIAALAERPDAAQVVVEPILGEYHVDSYSGDLEPAEFESQKEAEWIIDNYGFNKNYFKAIKKSVLFSKKTMK